MMGASFLRAASMHALIELLVTQLTAGMAKPQSCACWSRSVSAWPVQTPGCTDGGIFGYCPIAHSSVHGSPISSAAVPISSAAFRWARGGAENRGPGKNPSASGAVASTSAVAAQRAIVRCKCPQVGLKRKGCGCGLPCKRQALGAQKLLWT